MRKGVAKEVVVQKASKFFVENGLKSTMDEMSHFLKISKRTIYEQFEDKTDLLRECIIYMIGTFPPLPVLQRNGTNEIDNICQMLKSRIMPLFGKRRQFVSDVYRNYPDLFMEYMDPFIVKLGKAFDDCLKKGVRDGFVRTDIDIELCVRCMLRIAYTVNALGDISTFQGKYTQEKIFRNTIYILFRGMFTEKGVQEFDETIKKYIE